MDREVACARSARLAFMPPLSRKTGVISLMIVFRLFDALGNVLLFFGGVGVLDVFFWRLYRSFSSIAGYCGLRSLLLRIEFIARADIEILGCWTLYRSFGTMLVCSMGVDAGFAACGLTPVLQRASRRMFYLGIVPNVRNNAGFAACGLMLALQHAGCRVFYLGIVPNVRKKAGLAAVG